ncbi:MAG: FtsX-like permease family protein [Streptosporangiaceae bacterium]|jgi:putative ABC transport system permease protein
MLSLAGATVRTRWTAFVGTFLALACGVALMAVAILVIYATNNLPEPAQQRYAAATAVIVPDKTITFTDRYGDVSRTPVLQQPGLPRSLVTALAADGPVVADHTFYAQLPGGPTDQVGRGWSAAAVGGYRLTAGHAPAASGQIVVGGGSSGLIGRRVTVQTAAGPLIATVTGVTSTVPYEHAIFFTDAQAAALSPAVDALAFLGPAGPVQQAVDRAGAAATVRVLIGADRDQADPRYISETNDLVNVQTPIGMAAAVAGLTAVFVVAGTFALSVAQRRRELALLRLIGATRTQTRRLICCEALLIALLAGGTGCVLGACAAPLGRNWLADHGIVPADLTVPITWWALLAAVVFGLVTALAGVLAGMLRAGMVAPAEALREASAERGSRWANAARWVAGATALAIALVMLGVIAIAYPEYADEAADNFTVTLTVALAFSILAGVLIRPLLRLLTYRPSGRSLGDLDAGGAIWSTARRGALDAIRRTASVGSSVAVVVALSGCLIGGLDEVSSAQAAATRQQLSAAEYVITPADAPGLTQAAAQSIQAVPGVRTLALTPTQVFADQGGTAVVNYPAATADPDALAALGGLAVTAGSVTNLGPGTIVLDRDWPGNPSVGSRIRVWLADGTQMTFTVAALFRTPGDGYQAYIDPAYAASGSTPTQIMASVAPGAEAAAARTALIAAAHAAGARLTPTAQAATSAVNANEQDTRTAVLMILGLSVLYALIALADTLVMTVADRRRELALLRLAGATRRQVLGTVLAETLMCVTTGAVVGLLATAVSIGGSWAVLRRLIGPAMPLIVPWAVLAALLGACVVVAVLATGLPAGLALGKDGRYGLMREAVDGGS